MTKITVICPTYNSANFIKKTIDSIVQQDVGIDEIIFSDDGSKDNTLSVINDLMSKHKDIDYKLLKNIHKGPGAARNIAIKHANYDWVAFIDSDDIWKKNKISTIKKYINLNKNFNFFCHNEIMVNVNNNQRLLNYCAKYKKNKLLINQIYISNKFSTSAVVCKKNLFKKCGFFNEDLMSAQDHELWIRMSNMLKVYFANEYLGYYVQRKGNITSGSLRKKFLNEISIAYMHRKLVRSDLFYLRLARIIAMYSKYTLQRLIFKKVV